MRYSNTLQNSCVCTLTSIALKPLGGKALPLLGLMVLLLIAPQPSRSQDSTTVIPDGTQGETMTIHKPDTVLTLGNWYEFDGPLSTLKLGGGFLYEHATYIQDDVSKEQIDMEPAFKLRDFRITMSGRVKTKRFITWKAGMMYDGPTSSWFMRETGIMVGVPELSGHIFVGRTKEGFSLNKVMNGYAGWTMERQMALDVIPILADGVKWMGFLPKQHLLWNTGMFVNWLSKNQSFSTFRWQFALRIGWLPVYSEASSTLLHLGVSYRYGEPEDGAIRVRSRPEANPAPYFIDTDKFPAHHSNQVGGEIYFTSGSWMFGTECYLHQFSSPETNNPLFKGGDVVMSYLLTGESRPYSTISGIYGFVPADKSVFDGGPGAWELVLRFSSLDLNGGSLRGGKFSRITPMINWYLSENIRLELAYGYGILDRFEKKGVTQFFQSRIQFML
jgi:phosphate-selective porin OprO and OprP